MGWPWKRGRAAPETVEAPAAPAARAPAGAMPGARRLLLCADDFGLSPDVDRAILQLVEAGRLTHVSCLVGGPAWAQDAPRLADAAARHGVSVGLHLNLTDGPPLAPALAKRWPQLPRLSRLLLRAHLRRLPTAALRAEIRAQWAAYAPAFGREPDYLDGHQHVHHLPGVRRLVLEMAERRPSLRMRQTASVDGPGWGFKRWVIMATGGRALGESLRERHRHLNDRLFGVYDFRAPDYRALMRGWLAALPPLGGMIFCHPGAPATGTAPAAAWPDPIAAAREREFAYLASDDFAADLAAAGVELARRVSGQTPAGTTSAG